MLNRNSSSFSRKDSLAKAVPVGSVDEIIGDCHLFEALIENGGSVPVTVFINDRQPIPIPLCAPKVLAPGTSTAMPGFWSLASNNGWPMIGGITWGASAPGCFGRMVYGINS